MKEANKSPEKTTDGSSKISEKLVAHVGFLCVEAITVYLGK